MRTATYLLLMLLVIALSVAMALTAPLQMLSPPLLIAI
jgi:hypothetical protein